MAAPAWNQSLSAEATVPPPATVGAAVRWKAALSDAESGEIWYRYRVRNPGESNWTTARDFSPDTELHWTPTSGEGLYEIEITARNRTTGETQSHVEGYPVEPQVQADFPVISPTQNELVYLYSAPRCAAGGKLTVTFTSAEGRSTTTPARNCETDRSVNLYLAGLRAETIYTVVQNVAYADGSNVPGPVLSLRTGGLGRVLASTAVAKEPAGDREGVLFQNRVFEPSIATDLQGNVIWYYPVPTPYLTRPEPGGYFFALKEKPGSPDHDQLLQRIDLAGNVIQETNAGRINEQLAAMGRHPITSFHHEARRLPDGRILVLAGTESLLTDVQGPGTVGVLGDAILVLNQDLQVEWFWNSFDHLDTNRRAVLDEKCSVGAGGCAAFYLADVENDWLHGNSLSLMPDGSILYSARHQDWLYKIDYANGAGSGAVLWRLGRNGDFQLQNGDETAWFSHQHDANVVPCEAGVCVLVFDNGNTRYATDESAHSRGQMYSIDEAGRTAKLLLNIDLGDYALALGSAQLLENGNYHFNLGWDTHGGGSQALEYDREGNLVRQLNVGGQQYRSQRMRDLYTP